MLTLKKNILRFADVLDTLAEQYDLSVFVSTHPRTQKRVDAMGLKFHDNAQLEKPLSFKDYNKLQLWAHVVLSDSGTINEEPSILNLPTLNLREAYERPEGMEEAASIMVGLETERVLQGLAIVESQSCGGERSLPIVVDYSMPNVVEKVVRIVLSYRDYVMCTVGKQY